MFSRLFTSLSGFGAAMAIANVPPTVAFPDDRSVSRSQFEDFLTGASGLAEGRRIRALNELSLGLIKEFEGWVPHAYDDLGGYCTIGYGHLIARRTCVGLELGPFASALSEAEGRVLLERDILSARETVQKAVEVKLTDEQFGALSSLAYNIGNEQFMRSTMRKLLNLKAFDRAAGEFRRWVRVAGNISEGLIERRNCERALFLGQLSFDRDGRFSRSQCRFLGAAPPSERLLDIEIGE